jgi:aspartate 1-decarboxylase
MFKSKIHRATITGSNLNYIGSIAIDAELMEKVDLIENEKVLVVNLNNGARFETYVLTAERGSGIVCPNGGGARLTQPGDKVIIISFASYSSEELENFQPFVVFVDDNNRIINSEDAKKQQ